MTFDEMVVFVRAQADADATDAPDSMLQVHARVAYNDILSRKTSWDHLEVVYTETCVADQSDYPFSAFSTGDMDRVYQVTYMAGAIRHRLTYMTRQDAELQYGLSTNVGIPQAYTVYNDRLVLYPTPSAAFDLVINGFRTAVAWPAGSASAPDLPSEFHDAIAWYMLSGYYMSQEDPQIAGVYSNEYQQQVDRLLNGVSSKTMSPRPLIMGGARNSGRGTFLDFMKGQLE